jgi:ribose transport system permease protein
MSTSDFGETAVLVADEPLAETASNDPAAGTLIRSTLLGSRRYATVGLLAALVVLFSLLAPTFLTSGNWSGLLVTQSVISCVTFAAIGPLIVGEFDLSLGYALGAITMVGAWVAGHGGGTAEVLAAMIGGGLLVGLINGLLVVRFGVSSFIATLATGIMLFGLTLGLSGGQVLFNNIPSAVLATGRNHVFGVTISVWVVALLAVVLLYILEHTPLGRQWYATGGSERVAFLAGIPTRRRKVAAFALAGLLVAIGAILELGSGAGANPNTGPDFLLPAYAAAFLGVTTYRLGRFNIVGSVVAILLLAVGFNGLSLLGVPFWAQPLFDGGVLLMAVLVAKAEARQVTVG